MKIAFSSHFFYLGGHIFQRGAFPDIHFTKNDNSKQTLHRSSSIIVAFPVSLTTAELGEEEVN